MTKLHRKVSRFARGVVVTLHPATDDRPASIELREYRRRLGLRIPLPNLYVILAAREADRVRHERKLARMAKRRAQLGCPFEVRP